LPIALENSPKSGQNEVKIAQIELEFWKKCVKYRNSARTFLVDMFINILSFLKTLDILIDDQTRSETPVLFLSCEPTVPTVKRIIVHFHDNSHEQLGDKVELFKSAITEFFGLLKTFGRQNIALNMWKIVKKKCLNVAQKAKKMLHFCLKVKKVLKNVGNVK